MAAEAPNGNGDPKVKSFNPRPWSAELVQRFQDIDNTLTEQTHTLAQHGTDITQIKNDQNLQTLALQGVQKEFKAHQEMTAKTGLGVEKILTLLGEEVEDGAGGWKGTGLLGRMRRNEGAVGRLMRLYRQWIAWGGGFTAAFMLTGGALVAFLWWLLGDKLGHLLK